MPNQRTVLICLALAALACSGSASTAPTAPPPPPPLAKWISLGSWQRQPFGAPAAAVTLCAVRLRVSPQPDSTVSENVRVSDLRTPEDGAAGVEYMGSAFGAMLGDSLHLLIGGASTDASDTVVYRATFDGILDTLSLPHSLSGRLIESDINGTDTLAYVFTSLAVGC